MKSEQTIASELAPSSLQALCPAGVIITRVSLAFTDAATEETERRVDELLAEVGASGLYLVGDYVNYLHRTKGEEVARAYIDRSYAPETVRVATWVCRKVATERRLISPSFNHSSVVAGLDATQQELWLTKAREQKWKVKELRAELRQRATVTKGAPNQAPPDRPASAAWEAFEVFTAWWMANAPDFEEEQKAEADESLLPLVTAYVARLSENEFRHICQAREAFVEA